MKKLILIVFLFALGCTAKDPLAKPLKAALADRKITKNKVSEIQKEYATLNDKDSEKAEEYVKRVTAVIEIGGDSSHIDLVRKQVLSKKTVVK